jgi:hypothetical protein
MAIGMSSSGVPTRVAAGVVNASAMLIASQVTQTFDLALAQVDIWIVAAREILQNVS